VHCLFRLPDGGRLSRRFGLEQLVQSLYGFVDSRGGGGLWPGQFHLVLQFPRRVLPAARDGAASCTLLDAGFAAGQQEALVVEPVAEPAGSPP
jgi:ubiquitin fusion degradation protein 1